MRSVLFLLFLLWSAWSTAQVNVTFLQSNVTCFGNCDGFATAVGFGGTFPYTYHWSSGANTAGITNLCAGTYTVTVTDGAQNTAVGTATITQPNQLNVAVFTENQICGIVPDGSATALPSGGTAPYTYLWSNTGNSQQITGLAEGTYTVTVTDATGCTASSSAAVYFWNEGIWLMITGTNILCYGQNNGTAHVGPMSGTPPYTYEWSNQGATQDIVSLPPDTYTVTVTDVNGCSNTATVTISEPTPLTGTSSTTPAACGLPGSATIDPSGGTSPYSVMWSNDSTTNTVAGPAGPITVTVTDANGCVFPLNLDIPGNNTVLAITAQPLSDAGCLVGGSALAFVGGGSGNYTYLWTSGDTTATATNLMPNTYTVTVTDVPTGCSSTATATIQPITPSLTVDAVAVNPAGCLVGGSATATASGGMPPFSYLWDNGITTDTVTDLSVGQHVIITTDSTGCMATDTVTIIQAPPPSVSAEVANPVTCTAGGSALATASSGIPPYTFVWSNNDSTATATNLPVGSVVVTVTDASGCTATDSVSLAPPVSPTVTITVLNNATCTAPGSAFATASGGTAPYTFLWDNGAVTDTVTNLAPGWHAVTATDSTGCTAVDSVLITQPAGPDVSIQVDSLANCQGGGGVATAVATGGTPPYTFIWSNGDSTATATNLSATIYTVIVTDSAGCSNTATVSVGQVNPPTVLTTVTTVATCNTAGSASATASAGTPPYQFLWSNTEATPAISGLLPGTYTVTVTDSLGCTAIDSVLIAVPPMPTATIDTTANATCVTPGSANASATGGTAPYTFAWDNGESTALAVNLAPGIHTVTVTDAGGCSDTTTVSIGEPVLPTVSITDSTSATCITPGSATASGAAGTPPYTYSWDNGETTAVAVNLGPGTHTVTVTDGGGCTATAGIVIATPPQPTAGIGSSANATCVTPGSAEANATGGTAPYTFAWDNGESTALAVNLAPGVHTVTVTDAGGCSDTTTVSIGEPVLPTVSITDSTSATCITPGSATASGAAGTPPYTFSWDNGETTAVAVNLGPGTHTVTVTDGGGCTATASITIATPPQPTAGIGSSANATCVTPGSAEANATGGTAPYTFAWDNGESTALAVNLASGIHTVTVTDAGGCSDSTTVSIGEPVLPTVSITDSTSATCNTPGSATASGAAGTPPYTYSWDNGETTAVAVNLGPGAHTVTVTDGGGCTATASITIATPPQPTAGIGSLANATCVTPGSAGANATGGTAPYTFAWDNGESTALAVNLAPGVHTVTVTDAGGCTATASVTIAPPPQPTVGIGSSTNATCITPASAVASASGGTPPYQYMWDNGETTPVAINLGPGAHTVTLTDGGGCTATATITIAAPPTPTVGIGSSSNATCLTAGSANAVASGGTPPYQYMWDNGETAATAVNLAPGAHTVTITDGGGCTATTMVSIGAPPMPAVSIIDSTEVSCSIPGTATASASGGTPPYSYLWDNGETTAKALNLSAGTHTVTITDGGGCTAAATVHISGSTSTGITLGDFVWKDTDQNGAQHPTEPGVPGIHVRLIQAGPDTFFGTNDDITIDSTQTDSMGKYAFGCVTAGRYAIVFSGLPSGYQFTAKDNVNDDCFDSDANANGRTDPFIVTATQPNNLCIDAGIHVFCENVLNAGSICCDQTICEGETPALIHEVAPPAMGSGTLEYMWVQFIQIGAAPPNWIGIPGANAKDYQPGPLVETSYFMRCVRRQGCTAWLETNFITITVIPAGAPGCTQFTSNFTVKAHGNSTVQVDWATAPEMVQYLYTVEHSEDQSNWTPVQQVMGHYNAATENHYQVMDHSPVNGMNYYRLKRLSPAGVETVSPIREIAMNISLEESLAVYPNPVSQLLYVRNLITYDDDARVELFSTSGQLIETMKIQAGTLQSFEIPVAQLPEGIYLLRIRIGSKQVSTQKITKF